MKHPKGIWLRRGLLPYYLTGHRLAAALTEKGYRTTPPPSVSSRGPSGS